MRKSLLVSTDFPPVKGGVSHSLWQFSSTYQAGELVVLTSPGTDTHKTTYPIYRKKLLSSSVLLWPKWLPLLWHMFQIARREKIQMIQVGQILPVGTAALLIKRLLGIPYIVYVVGQDVLLMRNNNRKMALIKKILRNADGIFSCSDYSRRLAVSLGAHESTSRVAYPSVAIDEQITGSQTDGDVITTDQLKGKKVLLTVGNLVKRKGHEMTLRALAIVKKKIPAVAYVIVGRGPEKGRLTVLVEELELKDNVFFYEKVSNEQLAAFYEIATAFIMPSRELKDTSGRVIDVEGFGMVFIEAGLYGCPVIGGNTGGVPEAVADTISGLLVDPENKQDIAQAIEKLLTDEVLAQRLGSQGKERAQTQFKLIEQANKIKSLLHE